MSKNGLLNEIQGQDLWPHGVMKNLKFWAANQLGYMTILLLHSSLFSPDISLKLEILF
jgi:hypothetical protein